MIYEIKDKKVLDSLFRGWEETMVWSCLQDCMGSAYADDPANPQSAQIIVGDFCFFAGTPNPFLVCNKPSGHLSDFIIMVPRTTLWHSLIEQTYGIKAEKRTRYATKKDYSVFHKPALEKILSGLSSDYQLHFIDKEIYSRITKLEWAKDLCSQFKCYEQYEKNGLGVVIMKDGSILSGASSYTYYRNGIEIEIDTREDQRRKGLALACGAKLILECLDRNLYPSWDAHNKGSLALAQKLGYHFAGEYPVYEITDF